MPKPLPQALFGFPLFLEGLQPFCCPVIRPNVVVLDTHWHTKGLLVYEALKKALVKVQDKVNFFCTWASSTHRIWFSFFTCFAQRATLSSWWNRQSWQSQDPAKTMKIAPEDTFQWHATTLLHKKQVMLWEGLNLDKKYWMRFPIRKLTA